MDLFGFGRMTLQNASETRVRKYCDQKKNAGFVGVEFGGVKSVVDLLRTIPEYKRDDRSITVDQKRAGGEKVQRTVSISAQGDLETMLDTVFWDAGQARYQGVDHFYVDKAGDVGVKFHWGDDFIFVIVKTSNKLFKLYT